MDQVKIPIQIPSVPEEYPDYSSLDYWDMRYQNAIKASQNRGLVDSRLLLQEDWYLNVDQLVPYIRKVPNFFDEKHNQEADAEICIVGCGVSNMSEQLFEKGYTNFSNIDFSESIVQFNMDLLEQMPENYSESAEFLCQDVTNAEQMEEHADSFRLIIDKACLDCIACNENPVAMQAAVSNYHSMLQSGGTLMLISRGSPLTRLHLFLTSQSQQRESENLLKMDEESVISYLMSKLDTTKWERITVNKVTSNEPLVQRYEQTIQK